MDNYIDLKPFRFWCQKALPLVYDDSLSYYELLCKVVDYLNKTMENVETLHSDVTNLHTAYEKLQSYVNNYFSSLDVQEEINNKLDEMASNGELYEIIRRYTNPIINEQNEKINEQNEKIDVLKSRMDTFASLPSGSTAGNAELTDIRVGYNSVVYPSAGDAVRKQVSELNNNLDNTSGLLDMIIPKLENGIYNIDTGNKEYYDNLYRTKDLIKKKKNTVKTNYNCTLVCFNSNKEYLYTKTVLVQGDTKICYLNDDVKYFGCNMEKSSGFIIEFIDYVFPFAGEHVDYYYIMDGEQTKLTDAIIYIFDYPVMNCEIYATGPELYISELTNSKVWIRTKATNENGYARLNTQQVTSVYGFLIPLEYNKRLFYYDVGIDKSCKKSICCYGTSITNVDNEGVYPYILQGLTKSNDNKFTIKGVSGGKYIDSIKNMIINDANNYNIVIFEGVANDWYYNSPIDTIKQAIHDIIQNVSQRCNKMVFVVDYTNRTYGDIIGGAAVKNDLGYTSREYYNIVAQIFASYGVTVIDGGMLSGINEFDASYYVDQIHQSVKGGKVFANAIYTQLKNYRLLD